MRKMNKILSVIAALFTSAVLFTSCGDDDNKESHVIETTIHAEVSGAFTKAVSIKVTYVDFEGKSETVVVNGNYDGKKTSFDKTFSTTVTDNKAVASVVFDAEKADLESYKSEKAPWLADCTVEVKLDGRVMDMYDDLKVSENFSSLSVYDPSDPTLLWSNNSDWASYFYDLVKKTFRNGKKYTITADGKGINCAVK